jgi:ABC-type nitrate/sulfonate/bicarbonate transport system permease component
VSRRFATTLAGLAGVAAVAAALEVATGAGWLSPLIVAPPSSFARAFAKLWAEGFVVQPFLLTIGQAFAATAAAALVGIPWGFWLWRRPVLGRAYEPWIGAAFAAPTILLFPLLLVIFGRGYAVTVFVGFLAAVIPVVLKTREAFLGVPRVLLAVGRSFHLSEAALVRRIAFPAAVPAIFTGLRLGLIYALVNIIGMEFLIDFGGLGRIVSEMYFRYEIPGMYAAILLIVAVSWLFLAALARLETWLRPR